MPFVGSFAAWGGDGEHLPSLQRFLDEARQTSLTDFAVHSALVQCKGVLASGSDADLVLFDPMESHRIQAETQHLHADYTMYEGRQCLGMPVLTMQRGQVLVENGEVTGRSGSGLYLPCKPALTEKIC